MAMHADDIQLTEYSVRHSAPVAIVAVATAAPFDKIEFCHDQSYYWTPFWRDSERQAREDIERGEALQFNSTTDAAAWLMAEGDD